MIDTENETICKVCGRPITQTGKGPRKRQYCSDAHKEQAYRERKAEPQRHQWRQRWAGYQQQTKDILEMIVRQHPEVIEAVLTAIQVEQSKAVTISQENVRRIEKYAMDSSLAAQKAKANVEAYQEKMAQAGAHIQKLERQVGTQRSRISELTAENRTLRSRIEQLEQEAAASLVVSRAELLARLMLLGERLDYRRLIAFNVKQGPDVWWESINGADDALLREMLETAQAFYDNLQASGHQSDDPGRIAELETKVAVLEQQKHDTEQPRKPIPRGYGHLPQGLIPLHLFAQQHFVSSSEAQRLASHGMIRLVKGKWLVDSRKVTEALDAEGRRQFWVQFHHTSDFRSCDDCPHEHRNPS